MEEEIIYTTPKMETMRCIIATKMMPTLYEHIKQESMLTDSKLCSVVCQQAILYADELLRQLDNKP